MELIHCFVSETYLQYSIPRVDLFARRLNHQVDTLVSRTPEPQAWAVDAFSVNWKDIMFYAFPPFSVLGRILSNIKMEQASGILVLPLWQVPCYDGSLGGSSSACQAQSKQPADQGESTATTLSLLVTLLSGQPLETLAYRKALPNSSLMLRERVPRGNMTSLYDDGELIVANGKLIPLLPL